MVGEFVSDVAMDAIDKLAAVIHDVEARRDRGARAEFKDVVCMNVTKILDIIDGVKLDYAGNYHIVAQHGLRTLNNLSTNSETSDSQNVCSIVLNTVLGRMRMYSLDDNEVMVQEFGIMLLQRLCHTPTFEKNTYARMELYRVILDTFRFKELSLQARSAGMKMIERTDEEFRNKRSSVGSPDILTWYEESIGLTYYREHRRKNSQNSNR
jgi:hypothetical protein